MSDNLRAWLAKELQQRKWSHNELARQAKVPQSTVSSVISGNRKAGADFCVKVAQALNESPEKLLRLAGILPPASEDATLQELIDLARSLPPGQRKEALRYLRFLYQSEKEGE
jgi:transcriptional regulator with XRE-family HTH domain